MKIVYYEINSPSGEYINFLFVLYIIVFVIIITVRLKIESAEKVFGRSSSYRTWTHNIYIYIIIRGRNVCRIYCRTINQKCKL